METSVAPASGIGFEDGDEHAERERVRDAGREQHDRRADTRDESDDERARHPPADRPVDPVEDAAPAWARTLG